MNENIINLLHNSRNTIKKLLKAVDDTTFIPLIEVKILMDSAKENLIEIEKVLSVYYSVNIAEEDGTEKEIEK